MRQASCSGGGGGWSGRGWRVEGGTRRWSVTGGWEEEWCVLLAFGPRKFTVRPSVKVWQEGRATKLDLRIAASGGPRQWV